MTRGFFGLLMLSETILYSKYESRHKRRHEGSMLALIRRPILSQGARAQASLSGHIERPPRLAIAKPIRRDLQHAN